MSLAPRAGRTVSFAMSLVAVSVALIAVGIAVSAGTLGTPATLVLIGAELVGVMSIGALLGVLRGEAGRTRAEGERGR